MAACFCTNCGNKMEYSFAAPNFCGKCGTKLNASAASLASVSTSKVQKNIPKEDEEFDDEDDLEVGNGDFSNAREVPNIRSLAYELEHELGNRTYKLGDLFGSPQAPDRRNRSVSLDDFKNRDGRRK
jgi:DNA-directed RNA polymerase subunit M/transcription elongation factor TFIIS